jgi:hypothetical protein
MHSLKLARVNNLYNELNPIEKEEYHQIMGQWAPVVSTVLSNTYICIYIDMDLGVRVVEVFHIYASGNICNEIIRRLIKTEAFRDAFGDNLTDEQWYCKIKRGSANQNITITKVGQCLN